MKSSWILVLTLALCLAPESFPTPCAAGDASPSRAATRADSGSMKDSKDRKNDSDKKDSDKQEGEKKDAKEEPKEPPFEKVVKGAREIKGLFNVFAKDDEAKYFLEIAPD